MEYFAKSETDAELHIEGSPDGVKVVRIDGPRSQRLSDLALHRDDLEFAAACLDELNTAPEAARIIREALWRSAIIHFIKCFGDSRGRFQLDADRIYKAEPPEALAAFAYFRDLRNKHMIHDENSYAQGHSGAVLNRGDKEYKVEQIVCLTLVASTLEEANLINLKLLIGKAQAWATSQFDSIRDLLAKELEQVPYEALFAMKTLTFRVPDRTEINKTRGKP